MEKVKPWLGEPQNTIAVLQKYGFVFQKKYGQNFLIDPHVLDKIVAAAGIGPDDFVVEIGPGIGTLTQYLAYAARSVCAVEIDKNLIPILEDTLSDYDNVEVINNDVLKVDLAALPVTAGKEEIAALFTQTKYSRLLIYEDSIDHILGTVHQKDFYVGCGVTDKPLRDIIAPPVFALENEPIRLLLKKLQQAKTHVAVVVDEYGGTCGIVTMEDILEELVGEIWDEHDEEEVFLRKLGPDTYTVDAAMDLEDFAAYFHVKTGSEMVSVSGWVMEQFGRVPEVGDSFTCGDLQVEVMRVENHRIEEIRVVQRAAEPSEAPA